jgi:hypothetical protein
VQQTFDTTYLLDERLAVGKTDPVTLERLTSRPPVQDWTRTILVQVADGPMDPLCKS